MPFVDNDGVKIRYEVEGTGPPLVLMHGSTGSLEQFRDLGLTEALRSDYQLILLDARGHGQSDKPHAPSAYLPEPRTRDVTLVLDELGIDTTHYLGYSMGGRIGFEICSVSPDRLRSVIPAGAGPSPYGMAESAAALNVNSSEELLARREAITGRLPDDKRQAVLANDVVAIKASLHESILDQEKRYTAALLAFDRPALLFAGTEDPRHDDAKSIAERMQRGEFLSLPGRDHVGAGMGWGDWLPKVKSFLESAEEG